MSKVNRKIILVDPKGIYVCYSYNQPIAIVDHTKNSPMFLYTPKKFSTSSSKDLNYFKDVYKNLDVCSVPNFDDFKKFVADYIGGIND